MINTFIIIQNEPFYIPKMIKVLLANQKKYEIVGFTVLKPHRKNKNYFHWFKERVRVYNLFELIIVGFAFFISKMLSLLKLSYSFSPRKLFSKNKIKESNTTDINLEEYISTLSSLKIDVIISISCPQIFKEKLLRIPNKYCINAHGTLLPRHRGVFGSWWTLFSADKVGGSTIHTMALKLDAGKILWQKPFEVKKDDTQYSIAYKTKKDMAYGLVETLTNINNESINFIEPKYKSSYHRAPSREKGKQFHKSGFRIIKLKDVSKILSKEF